MSLCAKWCLGVFAALLLVCSAQAEPVAKLKATDYVNDFAHVLDGNTIAQMDEICRQVDAKAHAQIAVVTIHTLDGSDVESYAVDLFHQWGVGSKSTNRGVLILYAIDDHRARIEVGYGLEPILPDGKVGGFQREAVPLMRAGNYSQALLLVTSRVAMVIAQDAGVQITIPQLRQLPPERVEQPGSGISTGGILLLIQVNETANSAYQILVDAAVILYFIPFLYMYGAVIKLAYRKDRAANPDAVLIPGGRVGVWTAGLMGLVVVIGGIVLSLIPPGETTNKWIFEMKLVGGTVASVAIGLALYFRGVRAKAREAGEMRPAPGSTD